MSPKKASRSKIFCDEIPDLPGVGRVCVNDRQFIVSWYWIHLVMSIQHFDSVHTMWKAKVDSIQKTLVSSSKIKSKYMIEVVWFYTVSDVLGHVTETRADSKLTKAKKKETRKKIDLNHYHPRELILSSHKQEINPSSVVGVIDVLHFKQESPRPHVLDGCYFYRATYDTACIELMEPQPTCICGLPYVPHLQMQALCYSCRTWFHQDCSTHIPQQEALKKIQERWVVACTESSLSLVRSAMGSMRRGHPYTVEGDYSSVYQAQSILSALMDGDRTRYDHWIQRHGADKVEQAPDLGPMHGWLLCPLYQTIHLKRRLCEKISPECSEYWKLLGKFGGQAWTSFMLFLILISKIAVLFPLHVDISRKSEPLESHSDIFSISFWEQKKEFRDQISAFSNILTKSDEVPDWKDKLNPQLSEHGKNQNIGTSEVAWNWTFKEDRRKQTYYTHGDWQKDFRNHRYQGWHEAGRFAELEKAVPLYIFLSEKTWEILGHTTLE
ncbi:hypothetical protein F5I97DRAFT_1832183 [Phlebopus sp. FC_14]|nr:hypothetical protein F5I97DRAFT_1832183 [Phlebopus sp. FC_14]